MAVTEEKIYLKGKQAAWLFGLCFLVYFSTYLGRLNYSASLAEMIRVENMDKGAAGLIGTLFFLSYGMGQLVSGFLGDYLDGRKMIGTGLFVAALCNLTMSRMSSPVIMAAIWCVNGFGQSLIWSPLLSVHQWFRAFGNHVCLWNERPVSEDHRLEGSLCDAGNLAACAFRYLDGGG